jgi:hypothetical protein
MRRISVFAIAFLACVAVLLPQTAENSEREKRALKPMQTPGLQCPNLELVKINYRSTKALVRPQSPLFIDHLDGRCRQHRKKVAAILSDQSFTPDALRGKQPTIEPWYFPPACNRPKAGGVHPLPIHPPVPPANRSPRGAEQENCILKPMGPAVPPTLGRPIAAVIDRADQRLRHLKLEHDS